MGVLMRFLPDMRDIFFIGGLSMLGYGLWIKNPWIAYSVCGAVLMISGYIMGERK